MRRSSFVMLILALLSALVMTSFVEAQQRERGQRGQRGGLRGRGGFAGRLGGGADYFALLRMEEVRKEIETTEDQVAAIREIGEDLRGDRPGRGGGGGDARQSFRDLSDEERRERFAEMRAQLEATMKQAEGKLAEILLPHQMDRLEQLRIQRLGTQALADDKVVAALKITDVQQKAIEEAMQEGRDRRRDLFGGDGDREQLRARMQAVQQEINEQLLGVLSAEQKTQYTAMQGEKFEFPARQFGGRGGDRGGRRGGGGDRPQRPQRPGN